MKTTSPTVYEIKTLSYADRHVKKEDITQFSGINKDMHVLLNCNDFIPKATQREVMSEYMSIVSVVISTYLEHTKSKLSNSQRLIEHIKQDVSKTVAQLVNQYINNKHVGQKSPKFIEIQFKQTQSPDETFDISKHFKVNIRTCQSEYALHVS